MNNKTQYTMEEKVFHKLVDVITNIDLKYWTSDSSFEIDNKLFSINICEDKLYISMMPTDKIYDSASVHTATADLLEARADDITRLLSKMREANDYVYKRIQDNLMQSNLMQSNLIQSNKTKMN